MTAETGMEEATNEARRAEEKARLAAMTVSEKLGKSIRDLELSVRTLNCLENAGVEIVYDLVTRTRTQLLKSKNFGRKSLAEVNGLLEGLGLHLDMTEAEIAAL